ncbi:hypothetical protein, partial [Flavimaricola marinus]|uniref:hypothetical protein n=1 Tax=Flavimaricola marinus TaxID=1819565 RepID=UPI001B3B3991
RLVFLQNADDLRFAEPASLHRLSPQLENRLTSNQELLRGAGHDAHCRYIDREGKALELSPRDLI